MWYLSIMILWCLLVADCNGANKIYSVKNGVKTILAGVGAISAPWNESLDRPVGVWQDSVNSLFIASRAENIKKITSEGIASYIPLGGIPYHIIGDSSGTIYAPVLFGNIVVKVDKFGTVTTIAGTGAAGSLTLQHPLLLQIYLMLVGSRWVRILMCFLLAMNRTEFSISQRQMATSEVWPAQCRLAVLN